MRILLLNRNHIGDALFTTPAITALRAALPDAHIINAVARGTEPLFECNPRLDGNWSRTPTWSDDVPFLRRARRERFDAVLNFTTSSTLLAAYEWLVGAPIRIGFDHPSMRRFHNRSVPLRGGEQHHVENTLDLVRALVPVVDRFPMELFVAPEWDAEWQAALGDAVLEGAPWVGLNPGATVPRNRWPVERWAALAQTLRAWGNQPILFGGPDDGGRAAAIQAHVSAPLPSLQGRLSLRGLPAAIRRCAAFVSGDTGPMHVAAAVGTPVVALFGPADPRRTGPYTDRAVVLWHPEPGPDGDPMTGITVDEVADAVMRAVSMDQGAHGAS